MQVHKTPIDIVFAAHHRARQGERGEGYGMGASHAAQFCTKSLNFLSSGTRRWRRGPNSTRGIGLLVYLGPRQRGARGQRIAWRGGEVGGQAASRAQAGHKQGTQVLVGVFWAAFVASFTKMPN